MRRKPLYRIFGFFIAVMVIVTGMWNKTIVSGASTDSAVTFQNDLLVLKPEGINGANPDFFGAYTTNLIPGDEINLAIKLENASSEKIRFYFWASDTDFGNDEDAKEQSDRLLSEIEIQINLPSLDEPIYDGPANGKGDGTTGSKKITGTSASDAISLGWLDAGDITYLMVKINVPTNLGNEFQSLFGAVDWTFLCEVFEVTPTEPPKEPTVTPSEPPVTEQPTVTPVITEPPVTEQPTVTPVITEPPVTEEPTITPVITEPPITSPLEVEVSTNEVPGGSPTFNNDVIYMDIEDDGIPLGIVEEEIEENEIPLGYIVVDNNQLGKLPQTGTFDGIKANSGTLGSAMIILLITSSVVVLIKRRNIKLNRP